MKIKYHFSIEILVLLNFIKVVEGGVKKIIILESTIMFLIQQKFIF